MTLRLRKKLPTTVRSTKLDDSRVPLNAWVVCGLVSLGIAAVASAQTRIQPATFSSHSPAFRETGFSGSTAGHASAKLNWGAAANKSNTVQTASRKVVPTDPRRAAAQVQAATFQRRQRKVTARPATHATVSHLEPIPTSSPRGSAMNAHLGFNSDPHLDPFGDQAPKQSAPQIELRAPRTPGELKLVSPVSGFEPISDGLPLQNDPTSSANALQLEPLSVEALPDAKPLQAPLFVGEPVPAPQPVVQPAPQPLTEPTDQPLPQPVPQLTPQPAPQRVAVPATVPTPAQVPSAPPVARVASPQFTPAFSEIKKTPVSMSPLDSDLTTTTLAATPKAPSSDLDLFPEPQPQTLPPADALATPTPSLTPAPSFTPTLGGTHNLPSVPDLSTLREVTPVMNSHQVQQPAVHRTEGSGLAPELNTDLNAFNETREAPLVVQSDSGTLPSPIGPAEVPSIPEFPDFLGGEDPPEPPKMNDTDGDSGARDLPEIEEPPSPDGDLDSPDESDDDDDEEGADGNNEDEDDSDEPDEEEEDDDEDDPVARCNRTYNGRNCCLEDEFCRQTMQTLRADSIQDVDISISPPLVPLAEDETEVEEERERLLKSPSRVWMSREGTVLATGRLVDFKNDTLTIETDEGYNTTISYSNLGYDELSFLSAWWRIPGECILAGDSNFFRNFEPTTFTWTASAACHKPLYFEEVQLERYGHSAGPLLQPLLSGAHFVANIELLPYNMGVYPVNECRYALGHYRPGSCAPWLIPAFPVSHRGIAMELGAALGLWGIF